MSSTVIILPNHMTIFRNDVIQVTDLADLVQLHRQIGQYLIQHQVSNTDPYISSIEARKIARERGYEIPDRSLAAAYSRGQIQGARKVPGSNRWESPLSAFLGWFERWAARQESAEYSTE